MSGGGRMHGTGERLRRRDVLAAAMASAAATISARPARARAHRPTIGYLYSGELATSDPGVDAFRAGLAEAGYAEGRNVDIDFRIAKHDLARIPALLHDLIRRQVDVIVVPGSGLTVRAAKAATATIPIVFSIAGDPVAMGLVASLNRPGGNVTGITDFGNALSAKRLELLKQLAPAASRIAILATPSNSQAAPEVDEARAAARALGLEVLVLAANTAGEIETAFMTLAQKRADAFSLVPSSLFLNRQAQLVSLASRYRVAGAYPFIQFVAAGGLMSYGVSLFERNQQAGLYAGLILKGEKPADLPVRRLARFELAINMTTAKALGLVVPSRLLALADKVIE